MKGSIKKISIVFLAAMTSILASCQDDPVDLEIEEGPQMGQFVTESFDNLTLADLQALPTPFESQMTAAIPSNGRVATSSTNLLIAAVFELLEGAALEGIELDEERGLEVYRLIFQLEDESIIEVAVVKEAFEIIEIVGYDGSFEYDLDPQGDFIAMAAALEKAMLAKDGKVVHWELELEEDNKWEYEIHIENDLGRFEVEVDAFTGDVIAINEMDEEDEEEFEKEEEDDDEKEEKEKQKLPEDIKVALAAITDARLKFAEKEEADDSGERDVWSIYVETEKEAMIYLEITDDTEDLIYAEGEEGPFDYDIIIGQNFMSLKEVMIMVNTEMQSETYYWYYEQIEVEETVRWAFVIKVKDKDGVYHKVGVDAINGAWHFHETYD
ncbi:MAG: PepSY domain-containing protein [Cyclobacteriaceae bacterium]